MYMAQSPILNPQAIPDLQIAPGDGCHPSLQMRCLVLINRAIMIHLLKLLAALLLAGFVQQLNPASQAWQQVTIEAGRTVSRASFYAIA